MQTDLQLLIESGKDLLANYRQSLEETRRMMQEHASQLVAEAWKKLLDPLYDALPVAMHPLVTYDASLSPNWRAFDMGMVNLVIPGCSIRVFQTDGCFLYCPMEAVGVVLNYYSDGRAYRVDYQAAAAPSTPNGYNGYSNPVLALAHAAELAPANLAMEEEAKAKSLAEKSASEMRKAIPSAFDSLTNLIDEGKTTEAIARSLALLVKHFQEND